MHIPYVCDIICVTWLIPICSMTDTCECLKCVTWLRRHMSPWHVRHNTGAEAFAWFGDAIAQGSLALSEAAEAPFPPGSGAWFMSHVWVHHIACLNQSCRPAEWVVHAAHRSESRCTSARASEVCCMSGLVMSLNWSSSSACRSRKRWVNCVARLSELCYACCTSEGVMSLVSPA